MSEEGKVYGEGQVYGECVPTLGGLDATDIKVEFDS